MSTTAVNTYPRTADVAAVRSRPQLGLRTKLILIVVSIFLVSYAVTTLIIVQTAQNSLITTLQQNLTVRADLTVDTIQSQLDAVRAFASTLAGVAESVSLDEADMLAVIRTQLGKNPQVFGSTVAYEPFQFDSQERYWSPYYNRTPQGELVFTQLGNPEYDYFSQAWYALPKERQDTVLSPPYFDAGGGNIWMVTWSVPFVDVGGNFKGVATGDISFSQTQEIVTAIRLGEEGFAFLIDSQGTLLGTSETSPEAESYEPLVTSYTEVAQQTDAAEWLDLLRQMQAGEQGFRNTQDPDGHRVFVAHEPVGMGTDWSLGLAFEEDELFAPVVELRNNLLLMAGLIITATVLGLFVLTGSITQPLRQLAASARSFSREPSAGNAPAPIIVRSGDELEDLASAFNQMSRNLAESFGTLEQRVADRTRDLHSASNVARQITTELDINQLLNQVVSLTTTTYNLYGCYVFVMNEADGALYPSAAAGLDGQPLLVDPTAKIDPQTDAGVVALAARNRQTITVNDVSTTNIFVPLPQFPDTRAALAVPMMLGTRLVGVFDLVATEANRFSPEDVQVLTTLAEQTGIAIRNAQLFAETKIAREEAERSNRVKSQFLAAMSHELRTPLNGILNFTQFISSGMVGSVNERQIDLLNQVHSNGKHLLSLINDVLDISKIESGALELFIEDNIDPNEELKQVIATAEGLLANRPITFKTEIEPNLPRMTGDRRRIRQILLNLVSNACKFTSQGEVVLRVWREGENLLYSIKDTGTGIDAKDYDVIFESFRQARVGLRTGGGTGLGLPISRRLAEAHGGRLWFESTVGEGSTFYLSLPIQIRQEA